MMKIFELIIYVPVQMLNSTSQGILRNHFQKFQFHLQNIQN